MFKKILLKVLSILKKVLIQKLWGAVKKYVLIGGGILLACVLACGAIVVALEWLKPGSTPLSKLRRFTPCRLRFEEKKEQLPEEA